MATLIVAESPAAYAQRPRLVVDASLLTAVVFAETQQDQATAWMRGRVLCAPQLVDLEMTNAALNKLRRKQATTKSAAMALAAYGAMEIERYPISTEGVFALAVRWELSAYDAAYLWLAAELNVPLATFDKRLGEAARAHLEGPGSAG